MRLVSLSKLPEDATLARDILTGRDAAPLLRAGVKMTTRYVEALQKAGILAVYVEDQWSEGILPEPAITSETRSMATRAVAAAYDDARRAVPAKRALANAVTDALFEAVDRILTEIADTGETALVLADLCAADAYTFQHAIDVTVLGLLIGERLLNEQGWIDFRGVRQYDRHDERLARLGMGLILHDIGKAAIAEEILHKPGKLTESEWAKVRTHPKAGVELVRDSSAWCPLLQACVLRHHERFDGTGYPDGKVGTEIHEMARIAAVADAYDAITSERVYAPAKPAYAGVQTILAGAGTQFDPAIIDVFGRLVAPFPPGVELELSDGRRAIVVRAPEHALDRPVVRVISGPGAPFDVALAEDPSIRIAGWDNPSPADAAQAA
jgi:HD-GYP domain-containing protein (c-di-GMP phosphodiesterase class II)